MRALREETDSDPILQRVVSANGVASLPKRGPSSVFDIARRKYTEPIDAAGIPIDSGIPLPRPGRRLGGMFGPLLERLGVGQSAAVPRTHEKTLRSAVKEHRERHGGSYAMRVMSETEIRVWRTA